MFIFGRHDLCLIIMTVVLCLLFASCGATHSAEALSPPPSTLVVTAPASALLIGDTSHLSATVNLNDGSAHDVTGQAIWQSSNPAVVSLRANANISAKAVGSATITASYGNLAASTALNVADHFTVISVPDTQYMISQTEGGSQDMLRAEFQWIAAHQQSDNICFVAGEGDIVDSGNVIQQWKDADSIYQILDNTGIPYAPAIGNHDYDIGGSGVGADRASRNYNRYFGPQRFAARPWYARNTFPNGQGDNFYITFDAGIHHYLVLALEFLPRPEAIPWAQSVLDAHPSHQVILLTHAYLYGNGQRYSSTDYPSGFAVYGLSPQSAEDAVGLWDNLIRKNSNIIAVLSGHFSGPEASVDDQNDEGERVAQIEADYQDDGRGGSGMLRILKFYPAQRRIDVSSYSPYFDQWLTDSSNHFTTTYGKEAPDTDSLLRQ